jgi:hypothetical protein
MIEGPYSGQTWWQWSASMAQRRRPAVAGTGRSGGDRRRWLNTEWREQPVWRRPARVAQQRAGERRRQVVPTCRRACGQAATNMWVAVACRRALAAMGGGVRMRWAVACGRGESNLSEGLVGASMCA